VETFSILFGSFEERNGEKNLENNWNTFSIFFQYFGAKCASSVISEFMHILSRFSTTRSVATGLELSGTRL